MIHVLYNINFYFSSKSVHNKSVKKLIIDQVIAASSADVDDDIVKSTLLVYNYLLHSIL